MNMSLRFACFALRHILQSGIAQRQSADANTYVYFSFEVLNENSVVSFVVTPITGDPDLFVSTDVHQ